MAPRLPCSVMLLAACAACAPSLATMEPARTVPAGHLQVSTSVDVTRTQGEIGDVLEEVQGMATHRGRMTPEELRLAATATGVMLIQPPSVGYQVSAAYGLSRRFEVGARISMNAVRGWGRWQFLRVRPGLYGALGLGVTGTLYAFPVGRFVDEIDVTRFSRFDLDVPLSLGYSNRWLHVWGGPKLVLSTYDADFSVCARSRGGRCADEAQLHLGGTAAYLAGQLGMALGYGGVWLAAELTIAKVSTRGRLGVRSRARDENTRFEKGGTVVSPSVGMIVWF